MRRCALQVIPCFAQSLDKQGRVIQLGSFSKILAPGLRLGWAVAAPEIIAKLGLLKLAADTQCNTLAMTAVSLFLDRYDIDAHIRTLRDAYLRKKNLMLDTIRQSFPQEVTMTDPKAGCSPGSPSRPRLILPLSCGPRRTESQGSLCAGRIFFPDLSAIKPCPFQLFRPAR